MGNNISPWVIAGIIFFSIAIILFIIRRYTKDFANHPVILVTGVVSSVLGIVSFIAAPPFGNKDQPPAVTNIFNDYNQPPSGSSPAGPKPSTANRVAHTASQKPVMTAVSGIHIFSGRNQPDDFATQQVTDLIKEKTGVGTHIPTPIVQGHFAITTPQPQDPVNGQQTVSYTISLRLQFYKPDGITPCHQRSFETTITGYADSPIDNIKKQALTQFCAGLSSQLDDLLVTCR